MSYKASAEETTLIQPKGEKSCRGCEDCPWMTQVAREKEPNCSVWPLETELALMGTPPGRQTSEKKC